MSPHPALSPHDPSIDQQRVGRGDLHCEKLVQWKRHQSRLRALEQPLPLVYDRLFERTMHGIASIEVPARALAESA